MNTMKFRKSTPMSINNLNTLQSKPNEYEINEQRQQSLKGKLWLLKKNNIQKP